jgi:hypothetical protein
MLSFQPEGPRRKTQMLLWDRGLMLMSLIKNRSKLNGNADQDEGPAMIDQEDGPT